MGSITDIVGNIFGFFDSFVQTGSTAAEGFLWTGSAAADDIYGTITGSLGNVAE